MQLVSAHDLKTGAGFVLPAHARCVAATVSHYAQEVDCMLSKHAIDPSEVRSLGSYPPGSIVYVERDGPLSSEWVKLRVVNSPAERRPDA
jgi:hypothetical protein